MVISVVLVSANITGSLVYGAQPYVSRNVHAHRICHAMHKEQYLLLPGASSSTQG